MGAWIGNQMVFNLLAHAVLVRPCTAAPLSVSVYCTAGQRHEGEWLGGQEHGPGTSMAPDGSSFYGFWEHGKRHGEGVQPLLVFVFCLTK